MLKTLTIITIVVGGIGLAVTQLPSEETYERTITEEESVPEVVELDIVDKARQDLERINAELDTEETRLLEERAQIDARLEQIRETRVSFQ